MFINIVFKVHRGVRPLSSTLKLYTAAWPLSTDNVHCPLLTVNPKSIYIINRLLNYNAHAQRKRAKAPKHYIFLRNTDATQKNGGQRIKTATHSHCSFHRQHAKAAKITDNHTVRQQNMPRWQSPLAQNAPPFKSDTSRLSGLVNSLKHGPNHPYGRRPQAQIGGLNTTARKKFGQEHATYRS